MLNPVQTKRKNSPDNFSVLHSHPLDEPIFLSYRAETKRWPICIIRGAEVMSVNKTIKRQVWLPTHAALNVRFFLILIRPGKQRLRRTYRGYMTVELGSPRTLLIHIEM